MIAIVLGSGFGLVKSYFDIIEQITSDDILDIRYTSLEGHDRVLYKAKLDNVECIILSGKLHANEGYTYSELV